MKQFEQPQEPVAPITVPRPGHADFAGMTKYGTPDLRNILERSSARETAARVAAGAVARGLLDALGIHIFSHVLAIGPVTTAQPDYADLAALEQAAEASSVRCADPDATAAMRAAILAAGQAGDTLGGIVQVIATGLPVGLGSHTQWDRRLDGQLAGALMSIQAIKGVEIGLGFAAARQPGSQVHDPFVRQENRLRRTSNNAGGLEGGITNGEPLVMQVAMKPISTLMTPLPSVDLATGQAAPAHAERSDICAVPAAGVVAEAMTAIVVSSAILDAFPADSLADILLAYTRRRDSAGALGVEQGIGR